jgi:hypothetical protein
MPLSNREGSMAKRYLVLSEDGALEVPPVYVVAETREKALAFYCRKIQSKEEFYRDYVEGQSIDDFLAKLMFSYEERIRAIDGVGLAKPPVAVIRSKVVDFFSSCPELGELYMLFLEQLDASVLSEEVYEYISERDTSGYDAIEESTITTLTHH